MNARPPRYRSLSDYAIIGDAHTAALVSTDGSIDWCCWPHFDSATVFCRLLDLSKGGWFRVGPTTPSRVSRGYVGPTNVLATTFRTEGGEVELIDFMPAMRPQAAGRGEDIEASHRIMRLVKGVAGDVEMDIVFRPTFDYARGRTRVTVSDERAIARGADQTLALISPVRLHVDDSGMAAGRFRVRAGDRAWLLLTDSIDADLGDAEAMLERTLAYWEEWSAVCTYRGPYEDLVRRSALVLKLLTFEPSGALIAAPTTSLPEQIGGVRNWDYRYTWLRDSALVLYALQTIGYHDEAMHFFDWLERMCLGCCTTLQAVYTADGRGDLRERTLDHLDGYRGSRPVRIGNAAALQRQLDVYGGILDAAHLCYERMHPIDPALWEALRYFADQASEHWREPDQGIWEVRAEPQHFLYSKLLCWVALDRAVRLAASAGLEAGASWRRSRDEIRQAILDEGYDDGLGAFTQAFGSSAVDASALAIPLVGFLPPTDPRVRSMVAKIQEGLTSGGLVYRYLADDGLPGREATFVLCSFWLVDNLALGGRIDEARALFERVTGYANDVGLLAEQTDPGSGELRGNFPQGFTHLGLIRSALSIAKAERSGAEERPERAADRARKAVQTEPGPAGTRETRERQ